MINKIDLRKAISSIAISNAKRNTIYRAFSDLDSITKEEFDSVKSDISKVVESMLTKDTVGKANGVASLDSNGSVPIEQLGNIDTTLFLIVRELPTTDIQSNKIYLVPNQNGQGDNVYLEYLYVEDVWEKLGEFKPDINYDEIINKVKEVTVCKGDNHNINGGFDDNGNKNADAAYDCIDIGFNNKQKSGEGTIFIGSENTQTSNGDYNFCIGRENNVHDSTTTIGQNIDFGKISNSIGIGEYINMDDHDGGMYNIIIGSYDNENNADIPNGFISVGYTPYNINKNDIIYQIGGYDPINEDAYNLEATLTLEHGHEKYIYGIGDYTGTTTDDAKSLREVLEDKIETVYSYGSKQYLFRIDTTDDVISVTGDTNSNTAILFFGTDNDTVEASSVGITRSHIILRANTNHIDITANGIRKNDGSNTTVFATDGTLFDLTTKADASSLPTKISQLTNDSNFATERYVNDSVSIFKTISVINKDAAINGLFNNNGKRIDTSSLNSKSILIGFDDDSNTNDKHSNIISIGNNVKHSGSNNVCIGNNVGTDGTDDSIIIGKNINTHSNNNIIIGSNFDGSIRDGYISIGFDIYQNIDAIYQIAGHGNNTSYNLEETLTYSNQHKKYIYGIGGYDGTNSNTEGIKSLQEVLADKANASAIPTKVSQLTNDANFITSYTETDPVWTIEKTNYYTKTEIDGKGYLTAHQSLDDYAKKTEIPNVSTKADLVGGKLKAEQLPKLLNITTAATAEEVVTKFNALLADLKAKGYMEADTAE
ncbi:hypothetical protein [Megamonas funiformis]|uniref:hypothetical protein n=1 Tax=Megamonas funiformis TaxID=437897 RepID=UPI003F7F0459